MISEIDVWNIWSYLSKLLICLLRSSDCMKFNFDLRKMLTNAKQMALVSLRRAFFLMGLLFIGLFLFSTALGVVLTPFIGNGTQVFLKLFCVMTHGVSCSPLGLLDIVYAVFVIVISSASIVSIFFTIASNILAVITGIEPHSKGIALLANFISGICILILIIISAVIASVILLTFAFLSFGMYIYIRRRLGEGAKASSIISSAACGFSAIFILLAWPSMGITLLISTIPAFFLFLLTVLLLGDNLNVLSKDRKTKDDTNLFCQFCNHNLVSNNQFCGFCGKQNFSLCNGCKNKFLSTLNFCPTCGLENLNKENTSDNLIEKKQ